MIQYKELHEKIHEKPYTKLHKTNKSIILTILSAILIITSLGGCSGYSISDQGGTKEVLMIVKSTESSFWKSVIEGADTASATYNMDVKIGCPENEEDYKTQNHLIEQSVKDGVKYIILSAVDYNASVPYIEEAYKQGVHFIIIDSDVNTDKVDIRIGTDNYKAGIMSGNALLENEEEILNIGIVNYDINSKNGQQREAGFRDTVNKDKRASIVETINVLSSTEDAKRGTIELLSQHPEINSIVTFNEWTSLGVGYAIRELGLKDQVHVVAFDCNIISVDMLETGEVDALIVQNPYSMGYLAVEAAFASANNWKREEERIDTSTLQVTRENMYTEEAQKALFAFE